MSSPFDIKRVRGLRVADIIQLATIEDETAVETLRQVITWRYEHAILAAKALAGSGSAIIIAALIPVLQPAADTDPFVGWGWVFGSAAVIISFGVLQFYRARTKYKELIAAQRLLWNLRQIRPFLVKYGDEASL